MTVEAKAERRAAGTGKGNWPGASAETEKESVRWQEGLDKALELAAACPDA